MNWMQYFFQLPQQDQVAEIRKRARLKYSRGGRLAKLNVGECRIYIAAESLLQHPIFIRKAPLEATDQYLEDPSHALVLGLPRDGDSPEAEAVGDLIAELFESKVHIPHHIADWHNRPLENGCTSQRRLVKEEIMSV